MRWIRAVWAGALFAMLPVAGLRAETFVVDKARSRIAVEAKATGHDFTGVLKDYQITIEGKRGSLTPTKVDLSWDFKDLDTGKGKRNDNMLEWLEHAKTPKGSFRLKKWLRDTKGNTHARGTLSIHGVSRTITFPCTIRAGKGQLTATGTARFDYTRFSLPIVRRMAFLTVEPGLTVNFRLTGAVK